jgi:hypothetical protein
MGAVYLILISLPFILDEDARSALIGHDWANRVFRELVIGMGQWFIIGLAFLLAALFIQKANMWGLLALILFNVSIMFGTWDRSYGMILILPLCVSLICLAIEEYRALLHLRRRTA